MATPVPLPPRLTKVLKKSYFKGGSKMSRCKAPVTLRNKAYLEGTSLPKSEGNAPNKAFFISLLEEKDLDIGEIRKEIDRLDDELLQIFNRRAALALKIGEIKKERGMAVYDPGREKRIFRRMQEDNPGPLENAAIVRLFERVIDESRHLERIRTKGI
jgi:chorismate mutase